MSLYKRGLFVLCFLVPGGTALRDVLQAVNGLDLAYTSISQVTDQQEFQEMAKLQVAAEISEEEDILA